MDHFLNPANSSYYPGFPFNISIAAAAVCREGVSYLPSVLSPFGDGFLARTLDCSVSVKETRSKIKLKLKHAWLPVSQKMPRAGIPGSVWGEGR